KTSTLVSGIWTKPRARVAPARKRTSQRNRRLLDTMRRISDQLPASSVLTRDPELFAVDLCRSGGDDWGPDNRSGSQERAILIDRADLDRGTQVGQGLGDRVNPRAARAVIDEGCVVHNESAFGAGDSARGETDPPGAF